MKLAVFKSQTAKLATVILVAIVIVAVAGKGTLEAAGKYFELNRELKFMDPLTPASSQRINTNVFLLKETDLEREIFAALSRASQAHGVNLKQVYPSRIFNIDEVATISQKVTLEGDFIGILKSLRDIRHMRGVKISSVKFETEQINKTDLLVAHIYFQGVKHVEK